MVAMRIFGLPVPGIAAHVIGIPLGFPSKELESAGGVCVAGGGIARATGPVAVG